MELGHEKLDVYARQSRLRCVGLMIDRRNQAREEGVVYGNVNEHVHGEDTAQQAARVPCKAIVC